MSKEKLIPSCKISKWLNYRFQNRQQNTMISSLF